MKRIFLLLVFQVAVWAQNNYPKDYFQSPLDIPLQLSGNFGELRPNHFHAGFDFKTQKKEGFQVFAAAEGYVSRIKISHGGYGKAIYITHPNGFTTVYGHLQSGYGAIEAFIKKEQYKAKSYEIELFLTPSELVVKKREIIGISGNTGGSDGPHLHFEIRDTKSEKVINPMFFGFDIMLPDTKRPNVTNLMVYPLDENSIVNESKRPISISLDLQKDGSYIAQKVNATGKIGFGIAATDYDNVSWNNNGVYKIQSFLNGQKNFRITFDTFSFDESRHINAFIDYETYKKQRQRIQKLFMKIPFELSMISVDKMNGVVDVNSNTTQTYRIEVSDFFENITKICVPIHFSNQLIKVQETPKTYKYFIKAKRENIFSLENVTVTFPANTFYEDIPLNFEVKNETVFLHQDVVPLQSSFNLMIEDTVSLEKDRGKMFIAFFDGKKYIYYTTKRYKNTFSIYSKTLGQYKLMKDTVSPKINMPKNIEGKWISDQRNIELFISDDLSGVKTYEGYINGNWVLFEYESKLKRLTHSFADGIVAEGKNELKVIVTDNVGNSTIFETHFYRSQKP
jgi:murein DD-endopeptidase MepM/ murein hydrolase activator NlpD